MIDLLGHIGYIFIASGMYLLSQKDGLGWVCRFMGEMLWVGIGLYINMTSIWVWGVVFMIIDLYGLMTWRRA